MKNLSNNIIKQLARLGKTMLIPIAVLPVAGILGRIFGADMLNVPEIANLSTVVFNNLDVLFAIGAAVAYSKAKDKTFVIVGTLISFLIFKSNLAMMNETLSSGVFGGIITGICASILCNYSREWKVPDMFNFFAGEKMIISLSPILGMLLAYVFSILWPSCQNGMTNLGIWMGNAGLFGIFLYAFLNRLLIPTGLHQILNMYILFEYGSYTLANGDIVKGELSRFIAGDPNAGAFTVGLYISIMFGIPAIAMAITHCAKKEKRAEVAGVMSSSALTSLIAGITEPVEFSFMFVSPKLYAIHCFYTGISGAIAVAMGCSLGVFYSPCLLDYILNFSYGSKTWLIAVVGAVFFIIYYLTFRFFIIKDNVQTPGREDEEQKAASLETIEAESDIKLEHGQYEELAQSLLQLCGGKENIIDMENCFTRLRLEVKNGSLLQDEAIKQLGAKGVVHLSEHDVQIIIGSKVSKVAKEFEALLEGVN